ncbi:hypothetical protein K435DRAFT_657011 [Dendrothele bispora CBS 962.96]|uniref:Chromatin target of PRMT1 protein C-terminal domain-containing protein n=1 Tax=Dendrothele bispora (strain CBS 962.96) TaxID=1314807 RepID=A0A4S8MDG8_DENBC|nr:hypothetical protein K435DRAFT_657011 [Dendrothele bispora CBS 962.96]
MDISTEPVTTTTEDPSSLALSYDDSVPYEEQLPDPAALASRIGNAKVYLLSESSVARVAKRKRDGDEEPMEEEMSEDVEMGEGNALFLTGTPVSHLPTARIFAYATHFEARPLGLEWVDDTTCVLVFDSTAAARAGLERLCRSSEEEVDMEGCVTAKSIPVTLWPPEERINKSLGKGEGLKGELRIRWARHDDVKKKGAKKNSEFYRKHGNMAGKETVNGRDLPNAMKRRRVNDDWKTKERLDDDLDQIRADAEQLDEEPADTPSPPSKMRSDYIAADGRTLLERTSNIRLHSDQEPDLVSRITASLPRRARHGNLEDRLWSDRRLVVTENPRRRNDNGRNSRDGSGRNSRAGRERPQKTRQELDDELDAFLAQED